MKKSLYEKIQDVESLEQKIRSGLQAETLINNDAFVGSLRKLYDYYGFLSQIMLPLRTKQMQMNNGIIIQQCVQ